MTSIPQANFTITDDRMSSRGLHSDIIALILHPVAFFKTLRRRNNAHTFIIGILILISMVVFSLQNASVVSDADPSSGFDVPIDSFPIDPSMNPIVGGASSDPVAIWMTALTTISLQFISWGTLTIWLTQVPMIYNRKPHLSKNLEIVIWSSIPLALMTLLKTGYIVAGGSITTAGFAGFLDEWERFTDLHILIQSWFYALTSQITLFWLWHIGLLYIGTRYVLRSKRSFVLFAIVTWILGASIINSVPHYQMLSAQLPIEEPIVSEEPISDGMPSSGDELELEFESPVIPDAEIEMP